MLYLFTSELFIASVSVRCDTAGVGWLSHVRVWIIGSVIKQFDILYIVCIVMISLGCLCGNGFPRLPLLLGRYRFCYASCERQQQRKHSRTKNKAAFDAAVR